MDFLVRPKSPFVPRKCAAAPSVAISLRGMKERSGFRYHASTGLVNEQYVEVIAKLMRMCTPWQPSAEAGDMRRYADYDEIALPQPRG
jgi:hypothetical protein